MVLWFPLGKGITEGMEDSGIARLEVKFRYFRKTNGGVSGRVHCVFIDQERESGDRRWLDTVVVLTVNDANSSSSVIHQIDLLGIDGKPLSYWVLGGVWSQGWNLKELTERHHQEWSLRLNSTQRGKTHQDRTVSRLTGERVLSWFTGWWCMVVLSSWSDLST